MSNINAKNQVLELLARRGLSADLARYRHAPTPGGWTSVLELELPGRPLLSGTGRGHRKSQADIAAAADVLAQLAAETETAPRDWEPVFAEAQAGDALLKLAAYLAESSETREERSWWLQLHESDSALARVYDQWLAEGAPELTMYGSGLGEKLKSTLVEAVIWRRYGSRVLGVGAVAALGELREVLSRQGS